MTRWILLLVLLAVLFQDAFRRFVTRVLAPEFERGRTAWLESLELERFIEPGAKVLDFGAGFGVATRVLRRAGFKVRPLDISSDCYLGDPRDVTVYDGSVIPFPDKSFDVGLACTVLHHIPDPIAALKELFRVCRRVIVVEDVPTGPLHELVIWALDSVGNCEFLGHPHSNKTGPEWQRCFRDLGASLEHEVRVGGVFNHIIYVVSPNT